MSARKIKGPTPVANSQFGTPYAHQVDVPATSSTPDPYAPDAKGVSRRQGQEVVTQKAHAQFRQIEFQRAILQHGYFVRWYKAVTCPCMNPETHQTLVNCTTCDGSGFFYIDPIEIRAIMSDLERNMRIFEKFGEWVEGTSRLTTEPQYRLGYRDRIQHLDSVMTHNDLFQKGDRRGTRSKLPALHDSVRYRVTRMTKLVVTGASVDVKCCTAKMLPSGVTPDDVKDDTVITLEEGYHFNITKDGWIEWTFEGNRFVFDEAWVSALYEYHPVYVVVSHPHATRMEILEVKVPKQRSFALPVQALVKLDYLSDINVPVASMTTF